MMKLIAHRAGTDQYPEQSMLAARFSLSQGADMVEIDVRLTRDNVPVICHDSNVERMYGVNREVSAMTLTEFLALRNRNDPAIATYTLAMVLGQQLRPLLLHVKCDNREQWPIILGVIRRYDAQAHVVLGIGDLGAVELIKAFDPRLRVLAFMHSLEDLDAFLTTPCEYIRLWEPWLTKAALDRVHGHGKEVWVMSGTYDTVGYTAWENLRRWEAMGVDRVLINEILKGFAYLKGGEAP